MLRRILRRLVNRTPPEETKPPTRRTSAPQVDMSNIECGAQELYERLEAGEPVIIVDVREVQELRAHGVIESSKHMPLREIAVRWTELKEANEVVCYCASGSRSYNAAMLLRKNGLFNATSLEGGIAAWKAIDAPVLNFEE